MGFRQLRNLHCRYSWYPSWSLGLVLTIRNILWDCFHNKFVGCYKLATKRSNEWKTEFSLYEFIIDQFLTVKFKFKRSISETYEKNFTFRLILPFFFFYLLSVYSPSPLPFSIILIFKVIVSWKKSSYFFKRGEKRWKETRNKWNFTFWWFSKFVGLS